MKHRRGYSSVLRALVLTAATVIILSPVIWFVLVSFMNYEAVLRGIPSFEDLTLGHYKDLSIRVPLGRILTDTFVLALFSALLAALLSAPSAYAASRKGGRLSTILYTTSLTTWLVPPVAFSLQIYLWFIRLRLYDEIGGLLILYTVINATLIIILLTPFIDRIPKHLDEAAWVDGLRGFRVLFEVHLPALGQLLLAITMLCFVRSWNELLFATVLTDTRVRTISVSISSMLTGSHIDWGQIAALGTIALLPALLAVLILWLIGGARLWRRGRNKGAVKL